MKEGDILYADWGRLLSERFPPRDAATARPEWDALKQRLAVGQTVTGTVVAKAPFGAWLDITDNCAYGLSVAPTPSTGEAPEPETTRIDVSLDPLTHVVSAHHLRHLRYVITDGDHAGTCPPVGRGAIEPRFAHIRRANQRQNTAE